ncbi:MAG: hypothetical protein JWN64_111 [Parcubacteria group bacterium]|nr:hypothetical protein [Parcubacteria group bacterium]
MGFFLLPGSAGTPAHAEMTQVTAAPAPEIVAPELTHNKVATAHESGPTLTVHMTSYNAVPEQTDGDPFTAASGMFSNPEIIAARSQDLAAELPFGTVVKIERTAKDTPSCRFSEVEHLIGYRVIGDTMNARMTNKIDVLFDPTDTVMVNGKAMNPSRVLGVCQGVSVTVVGHVNPKNAPQTQAELVTMFSDASLAMR